MSRAERPAAKAAPARGAPRGVPHSAPHEVRIIGGQWKRSKLPVADKPGLRPTPDRVRETLFNWLGQDLDGWRVLDAFAGSGALGFEAASRGAAEVLLLERDPQLARGLEANRVRLKGEHMRVESSDAIAWMRRSAPQRFELVLLDPPFAEGLFEDALRAAAPLLVDGGYLYLEAPEVLEPPAECGLALWREGRAGAVHYRVFRRSG